MTVAPTARIRHCGKKEEGPNRSQEPNHTSLHASSSSMFFTRRNFLKHLDCDVVSPAATPTKSVAMVSPQHAVTVGRPAPQSEASAAKAKPYAGSTMLPAEL